MPFPILGASAQHDTLKRQSTFDAKGYELGGELRQTR
eukprot:COSAG02_NODE_21639_length_780_cov_1.546256_1_plen_36_part_10